MKFTLQSNCSADPLNICIGFLQQLKMKTNNEAFKERQLLTVQKALNVLKCIFTIFVP